ncbi:MAG TPA: hypothetical protein VKR58_00195 [Aquella sp.]|nr:hypothetical protein [Aquella sp.]
MKLVKFYKLNCYVFIGLMCMSEAQAKIVRTVDGVCVPKKDSTKPTVTWQYKQTRKKRTDTYEDPEELTTSLGITKKTTGLSITGANGNLLTVGLAIGDDGRHWLVEDSRTVSQDPSGRLCNYQSDKTVPLLDYSCSCSVSKVVDIDDISGECTYSWPLALTCEEGK